MIVVMYTIDDPSENYHVVYQGVDEYRLIDRSKNQDYCQRSDCACFSFLHKSLSINYHDFFIKKNDLMKSLCFFCN